MSDNDSKVIEDLIHSAGELPNHSLRFRKRVLRTAKQAKERQRIIRRVKWAAVTSGVAIAMAACFHAFTAPETPSDIYTRGSVQGSEKSSRDAGEKKWDFLETLNR